MTIAPHSPSYGYLPRLLRILRARRATANQRSLSLRAVGAAIALGLVTAYSVAPRASQAAVFDLVSPNRDGLIAVDPRTRGLVTAYPMPPFGTNPSLRNVAIHLGAQYRVISAAAANALRVIPNYDAGLLSAYPQFDTVAAGGDFASPLGLAFGPDGDLYVAAGNSGKVLRFNGQTGAYVAPVVSNLVEPRDVAFGPDGHLYVADYTGRETDGRGLVRRFGTYHTPFADLGTFGSASTENLVYPASLLFDREGRLFVGNTGGVKVFDRQGSLVATIPITTQDGGPALVRGGVEGPDGDYYFTELSGSVRRIQRDNLVLVEERWFSTEPFSSPPDPLTDIGVAATGWTLVAGATDAVFQPLGSRAPLNQTGSGVFAFKPGLEGGKAVSLGGYFAHEFGEPVAVTRAGETGAYVVTRGDDSGYPTRLVHVDVPTAAQTIVAEVAPGGRAGGMAADRDGAVLFLANHELYRWTPCAGLSVVASGGLLADWTPRDFEAAETYGAQPIAVAPDGRIYVGSDAGIVEVSPSGSQSLLVSRSTLEYNPDDLFLYGIAVDIEGSVLALVWHKTCTPGGCIPLGSRVYRVSTRPENRGQVDNSRFTITGISEWDGYDSQPRAIAMDDTGNRLFAGQIRGMVESFRRVDPIPGSRGFSAVVPDSGHPSVRSLHRLDALYHDGPRGRAPDFSFDCRVTAALKVFEEGFATREGPFGGEDPYGEFVRLYRDVRVPRYLDPSQALPRTPQRLIEGRLDAWIGGDQEASGDPNLPIDALASYLRAQTAVANVALTNAEEYGYQDGEGGQVYDLPAALRDALAASAQELRNVLRYLPALESLRSRDIARGLSIETSGLRDLARALETTVQIAQVLFDADAPKAREGGPESSAHQALLDLIGQQSPLQFALGRVAATLDPSSFEATGFESVRYRLATLSAAMRRLDEGFVDAVSLRGAVEGFVGSHAGEVTIRANYVPNPSVGAAQYLAHAVDTKVEAIQAWQEKVQQQRSYDVDQSALANAMAALRTQYLDRMETLTGIDPDRPGYLGGSPASALGDSEAVNRYLADAFSEQEGGAFGVQRARVTQLEQRLANLDEIVEEFIPQRIRTEEDRWLGQASVIINNVKRFDVIDWATRNLSKDNKKSIDWERFQQSCDQRELFSVLCPEGDVCVPTLDSVFQTDSKQDKESCPALAGMIGAEGNSGLLNGFYLTKLRNQLAALQQVQIEGVNSQAFIKNLLIEQEIAKNNVVEASTELIAGLRQLEQLYLELRILIDEYQSAKADLSQAYFANPAYRLLRDEYAERAGLRLQTARTAAYRFARRLEYAWADEFTSEAYPDAAAVFKTKNPFQVEEYLEALRAWDHELRQNRNEGSVASDSRLSLRRHVLGFDDYDPVTSLLLPAEEMTRNRTVWRELIAGNRPTPPEAGFDGDYVSANPPLVLRFPLNLLAAPPAVASYFLPSNRWNHKLVGFDFNLVGSSKLKQGPGNLAKIHLLQRGVAAVRRHGDTASDAIVFDADPWQDRDQPFGRPNALVCGNATINAATRSAQFSCDGGALKDRAVSASEWTVFINPAKGGNTGQFDLTLDLNELTDVELLIQYKHGAPPPVWTQ